ncbi:MAG TPA: hypothetical protein VMG82_10700 [Candidatus Sulfotelmatobacter sp.]|nr:hypothetical protein [Candidatus Sulfotelmatobacter sp.]
MPHPETAMRLRHATVRLPPDLRARLENARLDLLALFRALDRMDLSPAEIPQRLLQQLFELDADYGEALWALDQPPGKLNQHAMLRDTLAALEQLPQRMIQFRNVLPSRAQHTLPALEVSVRRSLDSREAYNMVPGRDPKNG